MSSAVDRNPLQQLREGPVGQAVDKAIEKVDNFLGPSAKAWLANGLDELRQAVSLGSEQVQEGNNPGVWGTITTGEATAERMGTEEKQPMNFAELRDQAHAKAKQAEQEMGQERERGGYER